MNHPPAISQARPARYAAHLGFVAPALGTPGLRPVILGYILIETLYSLSQTALGHAVDRWTPHYADAFFFGDTPAGMLGQLASFGLLIFWVWAIAARVHGQRFLTLFGPLRPLMGQFLRVLAAIGLLLLLVELLPPDMDPDMAITSRFPLPWLTLLPLSVTALLIQTGSEELFYRGYLQQRIAALYDRPLIWLMLPNLAFALAHWDQTGPVLGNLQYVIWAFGFGLAASDLTARAGNLGPALAFHLANNIYAFMFFGEYGGPDSGLALWLFDGHSIELPFSDSWQDGLITPALLVELGIVALMWGAARLALRR